MVIVAFEKRATGPLRNLVLLVGQVPRLGLGAVIQRLVVAQER